MKKFLLFLTIASLGFVGSAHATLYDWFNGNLPSVSSRIPLAQICSISPYSGTRQENIALEACLRSNGQISSNSGLLGSTIPTILSLFQTSLQSSIGTTDTSLTLVSGVDRAGNTISGTICLTVDSGTPSTEYICGTANGTAITALTRGIDPLTGTSTVASLTFAHRRGADVRVTDYPALTIFGRILNKIDSLPNGLKVSSTTYIPTDPAELVTLYALNLATTTGGSNASVTVRGVSQEATDAMLQSSSSTGSTGARTFVNGGSFAQTSTANKVPVSNGQGYIDPRYVPTTTLATLNGNSLVIQNPASSTATPSANSIPISDASSSVNSWVIKKFGGDGTDGVLSVASSTTTTLNLANAKVVVKNYSSISVSGTLNFTAPSSTGSAIILKSQGNCTLSGNIFTTSTGASGGAGGANGQGSSWLLTAIGGTTGGGGGSQANNISSLAYLDLVQSIYGNTFMGAGGGGGNNGPGGTGGTGGSGAGILIIECGGLNNIFSGTVMATGTVGGNGTGTNGGGGGGGGGGFVGIFYNGSLVNSGTVNINGGNGGVGTSGGGTTLGGGGGGSWLSGTAGGSGNGSLGGSGGNGYSLIQKNYFLF